MATSRVFYGWWVTLGFAVMVFISTGIRFVVGPFLKPMVADLGLVAAATIPADQVQRTHLGSLSGFRAQIVRVNDLVT